MENTVYAKLNQGIDSFLRVAMTLRRREVDIQSISMTVDNMNNSGIKLKVVNNTSKKVEIIVKDDDNSNPRVTVTSEGNTVNVTKK